ncbi:MAG: hypothetical protein LQ338_006961 [Usnochroma carphineum]|nr:MAG: hypothetical protein LQ338_006961 [Usnochroma carphineum]
MSPEGFLKYDLLAYSAEDGDQLPRHVIKPSVSEKRPSLFTPPRRPQRATPNSGKKRAGPDLTRFSPGSSHHTQMSAIFGNASRAIRPISTPRPLSANARTLRMPLAKTSSGKNHLAQPAISQHPERQTDLYPKAEIWPQVNSVRSSPVHLPPPTHRGARQGGGGHGGPLNAHLTFLPDFPIDAYPGIEPTSSGYTSPTGQEVTNPRIELEEVLYPDLTDLSSSAVRRHLEAVTHTPTCERNLCSTLPGIENWLDEVHDRCPPDSTKDQDSPLVLEPETVSSSRLCTPSNRNPALDSQTSKLNGRCRVLSQSPRRLTPSGCLTEPPRRKVPRLSPAKSVSPAKQDQNFVIYEDKPSDKLVELSPSVERYRKGCGPRRERCRSYWDEDILPKPNDVPEKESGEKGGRRILGDLPSLTKAKGFVEGVENAQFDFKVEL